MMSSSSDWRSGWQAHPQGRAGRRGRIYILALALWLTGAATGRAAIVYLTWIADRWSLQYQGDRDLPPSLVVGHLALDASAPALSPDGSRVAFEVPGQGILVCLVDGSSDCRKVHTEGGTAALRPAWNPATGELVFVRYTVDARGEESDIFTAGEDLSKISPLLLQTGNQDDPDISRDGRFLVYNSAQTISMHRAGVQVVRQLWILELETGIAHQVLAGNSQDLHPDWSPSGQEIAFASDRGGDFDIWIIKADGRSLRKVTSGEGSKTWPAWSPDGKNLLFTRAREGRQELWSIGADGTGARPLQPFGPDRDVQLRDADWR